MAGKLNLNIAEGTRVEITKKQEKQIRALYNRASKNVGEQLTHIPKNTSGRLRTMYLKQLKDQIDHQVELIGQEIKGSVQENMKAVAQAVVDSNLDFLKEIGMPGEGAFSHVPDAVVRSITTGKVYQGKWSLSKAIWGQDEKVHSDINKIVAEGVALNKSAFDIAKDLEKYVDPNAKKDWDWSKVYPGTNKKVDYSAQRLARTLVSHAYQQSFVMTTQKNPFVTKYKWLASNSHRTCEICAARNGQLFNKDELPLDHPNGMCTFVAVMEDSMKDMSNRIADWALGKEDPALDEYAKSLFPGKDLTPIKKKVVAPPSGKGLKTRTQGEKITTTSKHRPFDGKDKTSWINENLSNLRLKSSKTYGKEAWAQVSKKLSGLSESQLRWLSQGNGYLKKMIKEGSKGYWRYRDKTICMDLLSDIADQQGKGPFSTLFHEYGHLLDYKLYGGSGGGQLSGTNSWGKPFYKLLEMEYNKLVDEMGRIPLGTQVGLLEDDETQAVQDIIDGLSKGKNRIRWGHGQDYWTRKPPKDQWKEVTSEAFAHMNDAYINPSGREAMKRYFPESYNYFVKEVEKRVGVP